MLRGTSRRDFLRGVYYGRAFAHLRGSGPTFIFDLLRGVSEDEDGGYGDGETFSLLACYYGAECRVCGRCVDAHPLSDLPAWSICGRCARKYESFSGQSHLESRREDTSFNCWLAKLLATRPKWLIGGDCVDDERRPRWFGKGSRWIFDTQIEKSHQRYRWRLEARENRLREKLVSAWVTKCHLSRVERRLIYDLLNLELDYGPLVRWPSQLIVHTRFRSKARLQASLKRLSRMGVVSQDRYGRWVLNRLPNIPFDNRERSGHLSANVGCYA